MPLATLTLLVATAGPPSLPDPAAGPDAPRPATYVLAWQAPDACPDADAIRARIEALLQGEPGGEGELQVDARVTEDGDGFSLAVTTAFLGQTDAREPVHAPRCEDLSDTVALVVAIAMEPDAATRPEEPTLPDPDPTPETDPTPAPRTSTDPPPRETPDTDAADDHGVPDEPPPTPRPARERRPFEGLVRFAPALTLGALPRVGAGTMAALGIGWARLRLEVFGAYLLPQRNAAATGLFQLGAAGMRTCGRFYAGPVELPVCGGVEAGALRADGRGLQQRATVVSAWASGLVGLGAAVRGRRVGFWSLVEGGVPFVRPQFFVGEGVAFDGSPVTLRVAAGVEVFFGQNPR